MQAQASFKRALFTVLKHVTNWVRKPVFEEPSYIYIVNGLHNLNLDPRREESVSPGPWELGAQRGLCSMG